MCYVKAGTREGQARGLVCKYKEELKLVQAPKSAPIFFLLHNKWEDWWFKVTRINLPLVCGSGGLAHLAGSSVRPHQRHRAGLRIYLEARRWKNPLPNSCSWQEWFSCSRSPEAFHFLLAVCSGSPWVLRGLLSSLLFGVPQHGRLLPQSHMIIRESSKM